VAVVEGSRTKHLNTIPPDRQAAPNADGAPGSPMLPVLQTIQRLRSVLFVRAAAWSVTAVPQTLRRKQRQDPDRLYTRLVNTLARAVRFLADQGECLLSTEGDLMANPPKS
jgi:hypothetical protein